MGTQLGTRLAKENEKVVTAAARHRILAAIVERVSLPMKKIGLAKVAQHVLPVPHKSTSSHSEAPQTGI